MKKIKYLLLTKSIGFYINCFNIVNPKKAGLLGFNLFCKPRAGQLFENSIPDVLQTATRETFVFNDIKHRNYVWKGDDKIILLVHGWESNSARWGKLIPYLQKTNHTIVAIDATAHGLSAGNSFNVPQYTKLIAFFTKTYNPSIIIGHSIGGITSIYYQYLHQNPKVQKMVILGAPSDLSNLIRNYSKLLSLNAKAKKQLTATFAEQLNVVVDDFSAEKFVGSIAAKAVVVHDYDDTIVAFSESQKIIKNWKNAQFIETSGLGHSLHDSALYDKLVAFLQEK